MNKVLRNATAAGLAAALATQVTSCGLLLHPERKGQTGGRIDAGVAVLDAVGLLFYVIPGVVAFAVDFTYGTIYLPHTRADAGNINSDMRVVHTGRHDLTVAEAQQIVSKELNEPVNLRGGSVKAERIASADQLPALFRQAHQQ